MQIHEVECGTQVGYGLTYRCERASRIGLVAGQEIPLRFGGKIHGPGGAGELLAINPNTLRYKMKKLGIPFRKNR